MCEKIVKDQSLLAMIESDMERYGYMAAPNAMRNFIMNTQWDFNRRQWVGRQIKDNTITVRPDTYSPDMCLDLLRYALTCDVNEKQKAQEAGLTEPRFELVPIEALIAIDALWSLQGWHKPFQAIMEYVDIYENGKRYLVPEVLAVKRQPMPKPRYISVLSFHTNRIGVFSGLRHPLLEMHGDSPCMGTKQTSNGKTVMDVEMHTSFTVDTEGAFLALDFELGNLVKKHRNASATHGLSQGYKWWVMMGVISLSPQQISVHDEILKRTEIKEAMGLAGPDVTHDYLMSISLDHKPELITHSPVMTAKTEVSTFQYALPFAF